MRTHTVTSGSYMIGRQKPETMQAHLGSCVGVTLYDREAGIGGLECIFFFPTTQRRSYLGPQE